MQFQYLFPYRSSKDSTQILLDHALFFFLNTESKKLEYTARLQVLDWGPQRQVICLLDDGSGSARSHLFECSGPVITEASQKEHPAGPPSSILTAEYSFAFC